MAMTFDLGIDIQLAHNLTEGLTEAMQARVRAMMRTVAAATYAEGVQLASRRLKSTLPDYLNNFKKIDVDENTVIVTLFPEASYLEDGYSAFSMLKGLLNGPKSKISKKGVRYNTVPFRQKTTSSATNLAELLQATELKQALKAGKDLAGKPIDLNKTVDGEEGIVGRASSSTEHHPYVRGAVKVQKKYNSTTQSTYITFRRVSENTDTSKWQHPGFAGAHVFPDLIAWAYDEVQKLTSSFSI